MSASDLLWIENLIGLQGTRRHSRKRESKQIPFTIIEQVHMDTKINHEDIGKNRCHDPNTRLGKLMWNYFTKHVRHMEQVTKQGHYRFFKILASGPGCMIKERKMKERETYSYPLQQQRGCSDSFLIIINLFKIIFTSEKLFMVFL